MDFLWIWALATLSVRLPMLRTPAARTTRISREDLPHGGSGGKGGGLVALAMSQNDHGARTARDVLLAPMGMVSQDASSTSAPSSSSSACG